MDQRAFGEQELLETKKRVTTLLKLSICTRRADGEEQSVFQETKLRFIPVGWQRNGNLLWKVQHLCYNLEEKNGLCKRYETQF